VAELAERLEALSPSVNQREAAVAAETAHTRSLELARAYRVVRPAILHNMLVNCGLKERGLCYHWAEDLYAKLYSLNLRTLVLHRGVARPNTLREHNAVVITALGQPFEDGVVLDAWRDCGRLCWPYVQQDKYPWLNLDSLHLPPAPVNKLAIAE
jgi:hypothetical protein